MLARVPEELIDLPEELVPYRRAYDEAAAAVAAYVERLEAEYRERYPDPGGVWHEDQARLRNAWTEDESAELQRLREARESARQALWDQPAHEAGQANGDWKRWKPLDRD